MTLQTLAESLAFLAARGARAAVARWSRRALPPLDGTFRAPGLSAPVRILRDPWGVPHVRAATERDALLAQGFVHAQDRLAQMELNRRFAHGRLAELFGPDAVAADRVSRTLGFARRARRDLEAASPDIRAGLEAYAAGVNAWMADPACRLPLELVLGGARPEPWSPLDSLAWGRVMGWMLSRGFAAEVVRAAVIAAVGPDRASMLDIAPVPGSPPALPDGIEIRPPDPPFGGAAPFPPRGMGSNAFAVSPARSTTGGALLANDMHMPLTLPSLFYENHLAGGDLDVTGVSMPGIPMVMAGHNARICWGMTLAHTDVEDTFAERFDGTRYLDRGEWRDATVRREEIRVRGRRDPVVEEVVETRHGPVLSGVLDTGTQRLAVCSTALGPNSATEGWLALNRASGWDDFVAAMRLIEAPPLNVVYADADGNIGYWTAGTVPVRNAGTGSVPAAGWTGEGDWTGVIPFEEMPHARNPRRGYVVSCNQPIAPEGYPHFLGRCFINGWRARRITDLIEARDALSPDDCRAIQMDVTCLPGREFVARLEGLSGGGADADQALSLLRAWDGTLGEASVGGCVYEVARFLAVRRLVEPALGRPLTDRLMGAGLDPLLSPTNEFHGHDTVTLLRLMDDPDSPWVRDAGGRDAWLRGALADAVAWLRARLGSDPREWRWGRIHRAVFVHPLAMKPPMDLVLNLGPYPLGGDRDTPNQTAMQPDRPYDALAWAPSFRQVCVPSDWSRSVSIHVPGQSGVPGSPHYDDLVAPWLRGEGHPMLWTPAEIEAQAVHRITLER